MAICHYGDKDTLFRIAVAFYPEEVMQMAKQKQTKPDRKEQVTIPNDGTWSVEQRVEVEIEATDEEVMTAARSQATNTLKIIGLERARTRTAHDFNVKIKAAKGEAEAAARIVDTGHKIEMREAIVAFDPAAGTKTAVSKEGPAVKFWTKPMTAEELELGPPDDQNSGHVGAEQTAALDPIEDIPF